MNKFEKVEMKMNSTGQIGKNQFDYKRANPYMKLEEKLPTYPTKINGQFKNLNNTQPDHQSINENFERSKPFS